MPINKFAKQNKTKFCSNIEYAAKMENSAFPKAANINPIPIYLEGCPFLFTALEYLELSSFDLL